MSGIADTFIAQSFVAAEMTRMIVRQSELDPASYDYRQLMENLSILAGSAEAYEDIEQYLSMAAKGIVSIDIYPEGKMEAEAPVSDPSDKTCQVAAVTAPVKEPDPEPAPKADPSADPGKTYEMTDVRAALVDARRKGVNVTELLKEFGVENFSAFPAGRYGELMQRLGAA